MTVMKVIKINFVSEYFASAAQVQKELLSLHKFVNCVLAQED